MKRTICTAARPVITQIACVARLGLVPGLRLHAADFKFTQIDHPNALATEALGINDKEGNFNHPNARGSPLA